MGEGPPRSPDIFTPDERKAAALSVYRRLFPETPIPLAFQRGKYDSIMAHMRMYPQEEQEKFFWQYLGPEGLGITRDQRIGTLLAEANSIDWKIGNLRWRRAPKRVEQAQGFVDQAFFALNHKSPEVLVLTSENRVAGKSRQRVLNIEKYAMLDLQWEESLVGYANDRQLDKLWEIGHAMWFAIENPVNQLEGVNDAVREQILFDAVRYGQLAAKWFIYEKTIKHRKFPNVNPWYTIFDGFLNGYWSVGQVQHKGRERFLVCPLWQTTFRLFSI